jgi:hypothetical protein
MILSVNSATNSDTTILLLKLMKNHRKQTIYTSTTYQKIIEKILSTSDQIEHLKLNDHEMPENELGFSEKMKIQS